MRICSPRQFINTLSTNKSIALLIIPLSLIGLISCGGGGGSEENVAPVINLSQTNKVGYQNTQVSLAASVTDPNDNLARTQWTQVSGPENVTLLIDPVGSANLLFLAPKTTGEYQFQLVATDSGGLSDTADVTIDVQPLAEFLSPQLEQILDDVFSANQSLTANMAFSLEFDGLDFKWASARGLEQQNSQIPMTVDSPFRIASISKTVTVALALKLIEIGHFELDTPIGELLSDSDLPGDWTVADLHVKDGVKRGDQITIRQLMDQSSGINDFISYLSDAQAPDTLSFDAALNGDPNNTLPNLWTPELILSDILNRGLTQDLEFLPGERHHYGNSNTDLLAIIMEKIASENLHNLMNTHLFTPLEMSNTYMEFHQANDSTPVDHLIFVTEEIFGSDLPENYYANHNILQIEMNTSFAWAGGGLVSTLADLNRFFAAIENEEIIQDETLVNEWKNWKIDDSGDFYGLGLGFVDIASSSGKTYHYTGHGGFWGSAAYNIDPLEIRTIAWFGQSSSEAHLEFNAKLLDLLEQIGYQYQD